MITRTLLSTAFFVVSAFLAACGTLQSYPGPERPDAELAVLEGYNRYYFVYWEQADISAVDGKRPSGVSGAVGSVRLLPGRHWIEIVKQSYFGGGGGYTVCAFESDFQAGHRYKLKAHSSESASRWYEQPPLDKGSISIEVSAPGLAAHTLRVATVCAKGLPSFCRQDADCAHHPNYHCRPEQDSAFGICESREP